MVEGARLESDSGRDQQRTLRRIIVTRVNEIAARRVLRRQPVRFDIQPGFQRHLTQF